MTPKSTQLEAKCETRRRTAADTTTTPIETTTDHMAMATYIYGFDVGKFDVYEICILCIHSGVKRGWNCDTRQNSKCTRPSHACVM